MIRSRHLSHAILLAVIVSGNALVQVSSARSDESPAKDDKKSEKTDDKDKSDEPKETLVETQHETVRRGFGLSVGSQRHSFRQANGWKTFPTYDRRT